MQENKRVSIGSNFDIGKMTLWVLVVLAIVTGGIGIANGCSIDKKEKMIKTAV